MMICFRLFSRGDASEFGRISRAIRNLLGACFAVMFTLSGPARAEPLPDFVRDVVLHVLLHESAHALIHQMRLPVLGNEEDMADSFANVYIASELYDDAPRILMHRAMSLMVEHGEQSLDDEDFHSEHRLDAQRAYDAVCILYGSDPAEFSEHADWFGISEGDRDDCSDHAPHLLDGWTDVLTPYRRQDGGGSSKVVVAYGDGKWARDIRAIGVMEQAAEILGTFDWPEQITLQFDACGSEGASWSRSKRRILICDEYIGRFVRQHETITRR